MATTKYPASSGSPKPPPADLPMYQAVVARRLQWDSLLWQVPALGLAVQAFLMNVALSDEVRPVRSGAAALAAMFAAMTVHLLLRHRQAEVADAEWLSEYENARWLDREPDGATATPSGQWTPTPAHGPQWRARRDAAANLSAPWRWIVRVKAYQVWAWGLTAAGLADTALSLTIGLGWD